MGEVIAIESSRLPQVKGYRLLRKLAQGGMAQVYLAMPDGGGAQRVIKMMRILEDGGGVVAQRFVQEYAALSQVSHPHVARIHSRGYTGSHAYIVMEYLAGGELRSKMSAALRPSRALEFVRQLAGALHAIHAVGIVHGDLKPENIMLRDEGHVVLADFGIAIHPGTACYASPEAASGERTGPRSDLYSLGAILFELLTGRKPWADADTSEPKAPVPQLPERLAMLQSLVDALMAKKYDARLPSAQELVELLPLYRRFLAALDADAFPAVHAARAPY